LAHITIEYMIFIPVLIMQIFIFPLTASVIMDTWADSSRTLELQETAGHMASSVQQLYYTMNHGSISNGSMKITLDVPPLIDSRAYTTTLKHVTQTDASYQIMNITLSLIGTKCASSTIVTLGDNVNWTQNLSFNSTQHNLSLIANKTSGSIWISFGGSP
jgi:hypothetical protein